MICEIFVVQEPCQRSLSEVDVFHRQKMWEGTESHKTTDEFWEGFLLQPSPHPGQWQAETVSGVQDAGREPVQV